MVKHFRVYTGKHLFMRIVRNPEMYSGQNADIYNVEEKIIGIRRSSGTIEVQKPIHA
jgi:hypothetical protein